MSETIQEQEIDLKKRELELRRKELDVREKELDRKLKAIEERKQIPVEIVGVVAVGIKNIFKVVVLSGIFFVAWFVIFWCVAMGLQLLGQLLGFDSYDAHPWATGIGLVSGFVLSVVALCKLNNDFKSGVEFLLSGFMKKK